MLLALLPPLEHYRHVMTRHVGAAAGCVHTADDYFDEAAGFAGYKGRGCMLRGPVRGLMTMLSIMHVVIAARY